MIAIFGHIRMVLFKRLAQAVDTQAVVSWLCSTAVRRLRLRRCIATGSPTSTWFPRAITEHVEAGHAGDAPEEIDTPARRALYNNLNRDRDLALKVDAAVRQNRPDSWRGVQPREMVVRQAIYDVLQDFDQVERIFLLGFHLARHRSKLGRAGGVTVRGVKKDMTTLPPAQQAEVAGEVLGSRL